MNVKGNVYDKIEAYMDYKNKHYKIFETEYERNFSDYRDENIEEKVKYINENLSELPIHQLISRLKIIELFWDFDCVSLYPSAMSDKKSFYPKIETGYAFARDMNNEVVENFDNETFTKGSAILKNNYYNPKSVIVQHFLLKNKKRKLELFVCQMDT